MHLGFAGGIYRLKFLWREALVVTGERPVPQRKPPPGAPRLEPQMGLVPRFLTPRPRATQGVRFQRVRERDECKTRPHPADPLALGTIMGRGEGALDKAAGVYATINYM